MIAVNVLILLAACILVSPVVSQSSTTGIVERDHIPLSSPIIKEVIGYMNNAMEEYRRHINPRPSVDVDVPRNQEMYKVWKRNGDIINTLLGVPRRLFKAGR